MRKRERHKIILDEVHIHNRVLLSDLSKILNVSMDTIRRDIKELDAQKKLEKVHGGAVSNSFHFHKVKGQKIFERGHKQVIAKKAAELIQEGQTLLFSGGSTNIELVQFLPKKYNLTIFTPSIQMAAALLDYLPEQNNVIFLGGKLIKRSLIAADISTINILRDISVDICFLGTGFISEDVGISELDWNIAQLKKAMIASSNQLVAHTISKKLGSKNKFRICPIQKIDYLITELNPSDTLLEPYQYAKLDIL